MPSGELLWPAAAGAIIGVGYFAAMRWAVGRLLSSRTPTVWLAGGAVVRLALVLPLFCLVMAGEWPRMLACLAGFIAGRVLLTRMWRVGMPAAYKAG
jgi:F1F0 ATPase subunit 2